MGHIGRKTFLNAIRRNRYTEFGADDIYVIAVEKSAFLLGEDMDVHGAKGTVVGAEAKSRRRSEVLYWAPTNVWRRSHRRPRGGAVACHLRSPTMPNPQASLGDQTDANPQRADPTDH